VEVAEQRDTLDGQVIGVAFAPPGSVALFEGGLGVDVPILCDPERIAYALFGFGRRSGWLALARPTYWMRLLRALRRGRRLRGVHEDPHQLGGDAVLDPGLRLRWIYRSRFPADRPTVEDVRMALREAAE
jgi:hypothetical protein